MWTTYIPTLAFLDIDINFISIAVHFDYLLDISVQYLRRKPNRARMKLYQNDGARARRRRVLFRTGGIVVFYIWHEVDFDARAPIAPSSRLCPISSVGFSMYFVWKFIRRRDTSSSYVSSVCLASKYIEFVIVLQSFQHTCSITIHEAFKIIIFWLNQGFSLLLVYP